jgi:hypothetical protein
MENRMQPNKTRFLDALTTAAYQVSAEKLFLTDSFDAPIYPEALVQVVVGQTLGRDLHCSRVELEFPTKGLEQELCGALDCCVCTRPGRLDIVCWHNGFPLAVVEVKDQLANPNDGLVPDALRIQELLSLRHRLMSSRLAFGGLIGYVGRNAEDYKEYTPFEQQLERKANQSVATVMKNIEAAVDREKFNIEFRYGRCIDSARDANKGDPNIGTENEDPLTGAEQLTMYVVAVITRSDGT